MADTLVEADLRNVHTHGVNALTGYARARSRAAAPTRGRTCASSRTRSGVAVVDGDAGHGPGRRPLRDDEGDRAGRQDRHRRGRRPQLQPLRRGRLLRGDGARARHDRLRHHQRRQPHRPDRRQDAGRRQQPAGLGDPGRPGAADPARHGAERRRGRQARHGRRARASASRSAGRSTRTASRPTTRAPARPACWCRSAARRASASRSSWTCCRGALSGAAFGRELARTHRPDKPSRIGHFFMAIDVGQFEDLASSRRGSTG